MKKTASEASLARASTLAYSQFELISQIGTGSFGTVFRALHTPSNTHCAIKRIDLESSDDDIEEIQKEIAILATCNDNHITRYYGCFMYEFELWIVMEYLAGGSCLDLVKDLRPTTLPESAIAEILIQVVEGLAYLHGSGKIHRDIKAANVLIAENGDVKIADFGVAAQLSNNLSRRNTFVGTPFWMAPEVIDQLDYTFSADIWSLGITAIELASGKPPLSNLHPMKALFNIPRNEPPRLDKRFSAEFQDFVAQCLQMKPQARSSVSKLRKHPFLDRRSRQELLHLMHQRLPPHIPSSQSVTLNKSTRPTNSIAPSRSSSSLSSTISGSSSSSETQVAKSFSPGAQRESSHDSESTLYSHPATQDRQEEEEEDDWDFDTIKPQPSLEQILQNPPPSFQTPPPVPLSSPKSMKHDTYRNGDNGGTINAESHSLVRIFSHAAQKYREPVLEEISDLLRADPLTVSVENYLLKRISRLYTSQPAKDKSHSFDAVERILFEKWRQEVLDLHQ